MTRPGFSFCICPDGTLVRRQIDTLLSESGTENTWERHTFWGDEELPPKFWELMTLQGLFSTSRLLVVRNAQLFNVEIWKRLSSALARPNSRVWTILCIESAWEKGQPKIPAAISKQPCMSFADKKGWIWRSPGLEPRNLKTYIQSVARSKNMQFAPGSLEILCETLPLDASAVDNELEKLSILSEGAPLSPEQARLSVGSSGTLNIFTLLRQIQGSQHIEAWKTLLEEQQKGEEPLFYLLAMLQREARLLWQIRAGEPIRLSPNEMTIKKTLSGRLGMIGICRLWDTLHLAELSVKSGRKTPGQALDALLGDLTLLFTSNPATGFR